MSPVLLLVEDNPSDEKLALRALSRSEIPHEVEVVRDGVEALDYLFGEGRYAGRTVDLLPAVVLLDLKLPRIGGLDVLRRLRGDSRTKLLPVVVLTTSAEEEDIVRSYAVGANAYVRKPVDFQEFAEVARTIARFWLSLNEVPRPRSGGEP